MAASRTFGGRLPGLPLLAAAVSVPLLLVLNPAAASDGRSSDWGYGGEDAGPGKWPKIEPRCNGTRQSPIRLQDAIFDEELQHIHFEGYHRGEATNYTLVNDGHSAILKLPRLFHISGGNLKGRYIADSLHFHWGKTNSHGSEHSFHGERFPMEMHIVHIHERHNNPDEIEKNGTRDSLVVTSFLFEITDRDNAHLRSLVNGLQYIREPGEHKSIQGFPLDHLMPAHHHHYFRYEGSLTVPPCMERVTWTVFVDRIPISSRQLAKFRLLKDSKGHGLYDNFRPEQPLHDRRVYTNMPTDDYWFPVQSASSGSRSVFGSTFSAVSLVLACAVRD